MLTDTESYGTLDENELIKASINGERSAFEQIVKRYQGIVARTVKSMLGDKVIAEDIGQEVFIKLYYSLPKFRGEAKLSTYIQKIAVNLTLNEIKRRKRSFSMFSRAGNYGINEYDVADHGDESRNDAKELVSKALMMIDPKFRVIVTMRMLQGYSVKETAEILELPLGTVLSRLSRAQDQLRDIVKKL